MCAGLVILHDLGPKKNRPDTALKIYSMSKRKTCVINNTKFIQRE